MLFHSALTLPPTRRPPSHRRLVFPDTHSHLFFAASSLLFVSLPSAPSSSSPVVAQPSSFYLPSSPTTTTTRGGPRYSTTTTMDEGFNISRKIHLPEPCFPFLGIRGFPLSFPFLVSLLDGSPLPPQRVSPFTRQYAFLPPVLKISAHHLFSVFLYRCSSYAWYAQAFHSWWHSRYHSMFLLCSLFLA